MGDVSASIDLIHVTNLWQKSHDSLRSHTRYPSNR